MWEDSEALDLQRARGVGSMCSLCTWVRVCSDTFTEEASLCQKQQTPRRVRLVSQTQVQTLALSLSSIFSFLKCG